MEKVYQPQAVEQWYSTWEQQNYFQPSGNGDPYCIMIPPPNVTGTLHMGHGFQISLMDALIRYHRMCGKNTLWQVGTDHAGIATQMVVERELALQQQNRHDLGRDAFVDRVWQWKKQSGDRITKQIRRLGASVDWKRERFTMDDGSNNAVRQVFIDLFREGLIYRGKRLVNWDPKFGTAVSDLEVVNQEEAGHLWYIRYPLADSDDHVVIATTRPETLLGDSAVAIHPEDPRYQTLHGKSVRLPLCHREIPIILDPEVDPAFGTGCVKITPAHDFNDYQMGLRHKLPLHDIFTASAQINDQAPEAYQGLDRFQAREKIVHDLQTLQLVDKISDHKLNVPRCERSGAIIEPRLTDQWFVKMKRLAEPALAAVAKGEISFVPSNWQNTYNQWLENIEDWCISRQLWWGHRIPAWYDADGNVYVGNDLSDIQQHYNLNDTSHLQQDDDVLDTWFSSALWPFSTLGWPEATPELATFHPSQVLITGFDIIFFWVARMIMMGLKFTGQVPFHKVYITGLIRDGDGQKMSKSKGNVLDPLDLIDGIELPALIEKRTAHLLLASQKKSIEKQTRKEFPQGIKAYGTDAVRFNFCALANTGRDIRFDVDRLEGYRNFCNKLWNASRFVMMHIGEQTFSKTPKQLSIADRWIIDRLQQTIQKVHQHFSDYRFDLLCQTLQEFIRNEYCDWYLELSKPTLAETQHPDKVYATQHTLIHVLQDILCLLHPLMPYISESIWQQLKAPLGLTGPSIMIQTFPQADMRRLDEAASASIAWIKRCVVAVRTIRGEMNIAPNKPIAVILKNMSAEDQQYFIENKTDLMVLANSHQMTCLNPDDDTPECAIALAGQMEVLVPMHGLIDAKAEIERIHKAIRKIHADLEKTETKLQNPQFLANAPKAILAKEQDRAQHYKRQQKQLQQQLVKLGGFDETTKTAEW